MRRREIRDRMRRLRAWFAATHPGGAGAPPGTTMSPREELADGVVPGLAPPQSAARRRKEDAAKEPTEAPFFLGA